MKLEQVVICCYYYIVKTHLLKHQLNIKQLKLNKKGETIDQI